MSGDLLSQVSELTGNVIRGLGFEPVDLELCREGGRLFLRIYIDTEGGVTLDDCTRASRLVGEVLQREDLFGEAYVLEVMSPGLNRVLKKPGDFISSLGKKINVKLRQPFEGRKKLTGMLMEAGDESFSLDMGDELVELKYEFVSRARLDPDLPW